MRCATYHALPHFPSNKHAKEPEEESIPRDAVACMSLIHPEILRLDVQVEGCARKVDSVAVDVVFLIKEETDHGANQAEICNRERREDEV